MYDFETKKRVLQLFYSYKSKKRVSKITGVSRSAIRDWVDKYGSVAQLEEAIDLKSTKCGFESHRNHHLPEEKHSIYSYVLGLYLGDGHINKMKRTYRLRIFQNYKYQKLIQKHKDALKILFPKNKISSHKRGASNCAIIMVHNNNLPIFFPQHGPGRKHKRTIKLTDWQKHIVGNNPKSFITGLIDSDGARYIANQKGYKYVQYCFTNESEDIKDLFCWACDILEIKYSRKIGYKNISIRRRSSVNIMESFYKLKA